MTFEKFGLNWSILSEKFSSQLFNFSIIRVKINNWGSSSSFFPFFWCGGGVHGSIIWQHI